MEINDIIDKLFDYFKVTSIQDLAEKMNVSQPTISKWKTRNAMSAIKKRCRELGIYNEIFGDLNSNTIINIASEVNQAIKEKNEVDIDETTLFLFKEAYQKAKNSDNIKGLRIYLMEFEAKTEPFEIVEKITLKDLENIVENMIEKKKSIH
ncbi:hypothetical protein Abu_1352 [Aliarcobacter butzleri RM4018]|uniref:Bacteriophage CI repressor N-terminal domain-containing protein n=1 Tax=Aliarcobacter butzleri (strain RM4018) TaxID=367737 RepID=A8EUI4_ALIB4|nr:helix-turn-helix domain-containing protein [Aliarcobacter butzleri]ABV67608.1 hypothetical protein Abu_1352 [Aliarcobacter butzleri RM4018]GGT74850.1 hypothetical protein GCM10007985_08500 [Aliarcobacter butzleri]SNV29541.1 Uncharacterised protein [Aliarcobacter butzleri]